MNRRYVTREAFEKIASRERGLNLIELLVILVLIPFAAASIWLLYRWSPLLIQGSGAVLGSWLLYRTIRNRIRAEKRAAEKKAQRQRQARSIMFGNTPLRELPAWTTIDDRFPEVHTLLAGENLTPEEEETLHILALELDGTVTELLAAVRALHSTTTKP